MPYLIRPALRGETLVFVCEDDVFEAAPEGGVAHRLTTTTSGVHEVAIARDGGLLALVTAEEGAPEVHTLSLDGGPLRRLTWGRGSPSGLQFTPDDRAVRFSRPTDPVATQRRVLHEVSLDVAVARPLPWGEGDTLDVAPDGALLLGRHTDDLAGFQRYRGGRAGELWVARAAGAPFRRLEGWGCGVASPQWVQLDGATRLLFVADPDGPPNLYSCLPDGSDLRAHTRHTEHAVRHPCADEGHVVYVLDGRLRYLRLADSEDRPIPIRLRGASVATGLRPVPAAPHLESAQLHPDGRAALLTIRGRPFWGGLWEGPLAQRGRRDGERHRLACVLGDGERALWVSDHAGEEQLELCLLGSGQLQPLEHRMDHARLLALVPGPGRVVALVDQRNRVGLLDVDHGTHRWLTPSREAEPPRDLVFSADGGWLAFTEPCGPGRSRVRLAQVALDGEAPLVHDVTDGRYADHSPSFDPAGRYLFFLGRRSFTPVRDALVFGYGFPRGCKPYAVTLREHEPPPFDPAPRPLARPRPPKPASSLTIDTDGLAERVVPAPVALGDYRGLVALPSGRLLLHRVELQEAARSAWKTPPRRRRDGSLLLFDPDEGKLHVVHTRIGGFAVSADRSTALIRAGDRLRVFPADADRGRRAELRKNEPPTPSRATGWLDLGRARLQLDRTVEWRQMYDELWRLCRDHVWQHALRTVDWPAVRERHRDALARVTTRRQLADLFDVVLGELGVSHARAIGGDLPSNATRAVGQLAADLRPGPDGWTIERLHAGEPGEPDATSPLAVPGVRAQIGERIVAVDGEPVAAGDPPERALVGHAGRPVQLTLGGDEGTERVVWVRPLRSDRSPRLHSWVAANRARVRAQTDGRAGYLHLPDMGPSGYGALHRQLLSEAERDGLIVDVRGNTGGHVSQLVLAELAQRPLAATHSRSNGSWRYPQRAVPGPMVCLVDAFTSSDAELFAHHWRSLGLGPLVGARTWGGVVGIRPRHRLVDGTLIALPEFANWIDGGTGYGVEGSGVAPDIAIEVLPEDWAAGRDPQLEAAITWWRQAAAVASPASAPVG